MSVEPRLTFSLIESNRRTSKDGQPGQVARFEFSKPTKKNVRQHGRRADVTFVEYTSISTVRASTPLYVQNLTPNVLFSLMVDGEGCYLWVYNAGLWVNSILD